MSRDGSDAKTHFVRTTKKNNDTLLARDPAGAFGQRMAPDRDVYRRAIESQTCPFCGKSGLQILGSHTNRQHGVSAADLREMASLGKRTPTCSPEFTAQRSRVMQDPERSAHLHSPEVMAKAKATPRVMSEWGKRVARKNLDAVRSPEQRRAALEAARAWREQNPAPIRHGKQSGYQRGCRCDLCRAANTAAHRAWLARKKAKGMR